MKLFDRLFRKKPTWQSLLHSLSIVVSLVLIWRGLWYILDEIDIVFFGGAHFWSAVGGVVLGLLILYFPDKDLKDLEKL